MPSSSSSSSWSLEAYCALEHARVIASSQHQEDDAEETIRHSMSQLLSLSSQQFLQHLNLSMNHPFCTNYGSNSSSSSNNNSNTTAGSMFPARNHVPPMGPMLQHAVEFTWWDHCLNGWYQVAPPLLAMSELWLRLLASLLAPLCVAHLLWTFLNMMMNDNNNNSNSNNNNNAEKKKKKKHPKESESLSTASLANSSKKTKAKKNNKKKKSTIITINNETINNITNHNHDHNSHNHNEPFDESTDKVNGYSRVKDNIDDDEEDFVRTQPHLDYYYYCSSCTNPTAWWSILGVAASVVLTTDTLYVLEFGPQFGLMWLMLTTALAIGTIALQRSSFTLLTRRMVSCAVMSLWCLTMLLITRHYYDHSLSSDTGTIRPWLSFGNAHDAVAIDPGLYYDTSNERSARIAQHFVTSSSSSSSSTPWDYATVATRWMPTGDARTGLPYLLNSGFTPSPKYIRVWLPVPSASMPPRSKQDPNDDNDDDNDDDLEEYVALDIAFPPPSLGGFDPSQPVYLLLHGLNGGSQEEFVKDFANRRTGQQQYGTTDSSAESEHATVVVMVARGLMDLPIRGWNVFHGARTTDVHEAAMALHRVMESFSTSSSSTTTSSSPSSQHAPPPPRGILAGVGYSMGAIILNNYVARYGNDCPLQAAVSLSGGLDMRQTIHFYRAQRLWQPMLTSTLRHAFVMDKWGERVRARLTRDQLIAMMRSTHVTEIDEYAVVAYNGFDNLVHYYSEMSALGDIPLEEYYNETLLSTNRVGKNIPDTNTDNHEMKMAARIHNVSTPLLVVHALDDPLITWRSVAANRGFMHPSYLSKTGTGNLFLLFTKAGGHVGWPMGWIPQKHGWKWMNDIAKTFVDAVIVATTSTIITHEASTESSV